MPSGTFEASQGTSPGSDSNMVMYFRALKGLAVQG